MSNRTLVELNHDFCPSDDDVELLEWAKAMRRYMISAVKGELPRGVTFKHIRQHSYVDPMADYGDPS